MIAFRIGTCTCHGTCSSEDFEPAGVTDWWEYSRYPYRYSYRPLQQRNDTVKIRVHLRNPVTGKRYPAMENRSVLRGIATITLYVADLPAARQWYMECTGITPYFERPGYVEFRLGDFQQELGLIDRAYAPPGLGSGPAGAVVYWQVDDVAGTRDRLLAMGAREWEPIMDRGNGFITASVIDPFGNILGLMENPHYREVRENHSGTG
jgi:predicted enzyme related to lactoylglutathione lyase